MEKEFLGHNIPKLGFGLMRLPMLAGEIDMAQTTKMVDRFMESGFTYFDTAYVYIGGKSEVAAREAIVKRYPRDSFQLATKMPVWMIKKYEDCKPIFNTQLERTGAGYFDYYLLHALNAGSVESIKKTGVWKFVWEMKEKGLIKHVGFSFHDTVEPLEKILENYPEMEFVQLQINYADWENDSIQSRQCYELARQYNIPIIVMEPVKGGSLATMKPEIQNIFKEANPKVSAASWAIRYAASLDGLITVLSGMSNLEQMEDNINCMSGFTPLAPMEYEIIERVLVELSKTPVIPCTECGYCLDDCPQKINIPEILGAYNNYKKYDNLSGSKGTYNWITNGNPKASSCIACEVCESRCPQHIGIIDALREVVLAFE